jgi:FkbM family methyltransferase
MQKTKAYFDFGAHHGDGLRQMTPLLGIDAGWDIHLFEPNPFTDTEASLQGYPHPFAFSRAAVWRETGTITFLPQAMIDERSPVVIGSQGFVRQPIFDGQGSAIEAVGSCEPGLGHVRVEVPAVNIVDALGRTPCEHIYIKMDIEASEYDVLDALLTHPIARRVQAAYVEWHRTLDGRHEERRQRIVEAAPFRIHDWH